MSKPIRILGFDYGTKYIGIAFGQTLTNSAQALTTIVNINGIPNWLAIQKIIREWQPNVLAVGLPLHMDNTEQTITLLAKKFTQELQEQFKLPVYQIDERLTTIEARSQLFSQKGYKGLTKSAIDSYSAKLIVEDWLSQYIHKI